MHFRPKRNKRKQKIQFWL